MRFVAHIFDPATGEMISRKVVAAARDPFVALEQAGRGVCRDDLGDDWQDWRMVRDPDPEIGWRPVRRPEAALAAERLEAARTQALARLPAVIDAVAATITGPVSRAVRDAWPQKEAAAQDVLAGKATAPMLAAELAERGRRETPADLARKIVDKAAAYRLAAGVLAGREAMAQDAINAATTPEEIAAALDAAGAALPPTEGAKK